MSPPLSSSPRFALRINVGLLVSVVAGGCSLLNMPPEGPAPDDAGASGRCARCAPTEQCFIDGDTGLHRCAECVPGTWGNSSGDNGCSLGRYCLWAAEHDPLCTDRCNATYPCDTGACVMLGDGNSVCHP